MINLFIEALLKAIADRLVEYLLKLALLKFACVNLTPHSVRDPVADSSAGLFSCLGAGAFILWD